MIAHPKLIPGALALAALALSPACKERASQDATPPPPASAREVGSDTLAPLPEISMPELRADAQARPPTAYTLAEDCALEYRFDADVEMSMDQPLGGRRPPQPGIRMLGGFHMSAHGDRLLIDNDALELGLVQDGVRRPGSKQPARSLAQIRLSGEGGGLEEQDGPSSLWSAYGSFPGLLLFFPELPGAASSTAWHLRLHDRNAGLAVETERGTMKYKGSPPKIESLQVTAQVRELERLRVGDEPAVRLSAEWSYKQGGAESQLQMSASTSGRGEYVVLGSGRLLSADLQQTSEVEMGSERMQMSQTHQLRARARLVRACDGAVMPPPGVRPSSRAERALELLREFNSHMAQRRFGEAAAMFDAEVKRAHGERALTRQLEKLIDRFGYPAIGAPWIAQDVKEPASGGPFAIDMSGSILVDKRKTLTVQCHYSVQVDDAGGAIRDLGISSVQGSARMDIFEVNRRRLALGKQP